MIVKLVYKNEIRISSSANSYSDILKQVRVLFPSAPAKLHLSYLDNDGDKITISSVEDVESLKAYANGKVMKISITQAESKETATQNENQDQFEIIYDEEKLLKEVVSSNLDRLYNRAIEKFEDDEEEMINDLAKFHVYRIGQKALNNALNTLYSTQFSIKIQSQSKSKSSRSKSFDNIKSEKEIQKLVDKKIKLLIPSLIERVAKLVELRTQRLNKQPNCSNCTKYKKIITQTLLNTNICNEQDFEQICSILSERQ